MPNKEFINIFFLFRSVSLKTCPVCRGKNPSREHLANHFLQELAECLEGETQCSKCDFRVANTSKASVKNQSKMLALHHVTDHGGAELDELLTDLPLVQVSNYICLLWFYDYMSSGELIRCSIILLFKMKTTHFTFVLKKTEITSTFFFIFPTVKPLSFSILLPPINNIDVFAT